MGLDRDMPCTVIGPPHLAKRYLTTPLDFSA